MSSSLSKVDKSHKNQRAWDLLQAGQFQKALDGFADALNQDNSDTNSLLGKGLTLNNLGRDNEALVCFEKLLDIDVSDMRARQLIIETLIKKRRYYEALDWIESGLEVDTSNEILWCQKGVCLAHIGEVEKSLLFFDNALRLSPGNASIWNAKGTSLLDANEFERALDCFSRALLFEPQKNQYWINKAKCLTCLGNFDDAMAVYNYLLEINRDDADAWFNKGDTYITLGENEKALACFDQVIRIDPSDLTAWNVKENILRILGRHEDAIECIHRISMIINPMINKFQLPSNRNEKLTAL